MLHSDKNVTKYYQRSPLTKVKQKNSHSKKSCYNAAEISASIIFWNTFLLHYSNVLEIRSCESWHRVDVFAPLTDWTGFESPKRHIAGGSISFKTKTSYYKERHQSCFWWKHIESKSAHFQSKREVFFWKAQPSLTALSVACQIIIKSRCVTQLEHDIENNRTEREREKLSKDHDGKFGKFSKTWKQTKQWQKMDKIRPTIITKLLKSTRIGLTPEILSLSSVDFYV